MSLLITLKDAQKDAMRAKDKQRLNPIRMVLAAIKQREIDEQITLDDAGITSVIVKLVKQRRDSYTQYKDAGRDDLADIEANEIVALETFLPQKLSEEEIIALIDHWWTQVILAKYDKDHDELLNKQGKQKLFVF